MIMSTNCEPARYTLACSLVFWTQSLRTFTATAFVDAHSRQMSSAPFEHLPIGASSQAVFTSSYLHSAIIYVAVVLFSIYVYSGSGGHPISSVGEVYDNLKARSAVRSRSNRLPHAWTAMRICIYALWIL